MEGHEPGVPSPGCLTEVKEYLQMENIREYIEWYRDKDKVTKKYRGPFSSGWIEVLQKLFSAFRGSGCSLKRFLVPQTGFRFKTFF